MRKNAEALSYSFLALWLIGDVANLLGIVLTGSQLGTQLITAVYFVVVDLVLLLQTLYYNALRVVSHSSSQETRPLVQVETLAGKSRRAASMGAISALTSLLLPCFALAEEGDEQTKCSHEGNDSPMLRFAGQIFGWISGLCYVASRLFQLWKNERRGTAEGLSLGMFTLALWANITYGVSVLIELQSVRRAVESMSWLFGSIGTIPFDIVIFRQAWPRDLPCHFSSLFLLGLSLTRTWMRRLRFLCRLAARTARSAKESLRKIHELSCRMSLGAGTW